MHNAAHIAEMCDAQRRATGNFVLETPGGIPIRTMHRLLLPLYRRLRTVTGDWSISWTGPAQSLGGTTEVTGRCWHTGIVA